MGTIWQYIPWFRRECWLDPTCRGRMLSTVLSSASIGSRLGGKLGRGPVTPLSQIQGRSTDWGASSCGILRGLAQGPKHSRSHVPSKMPPGDGKIYFSEVGAAHHITIYHDILNHTCMDLTSDPILSSSYVRLHLHFIIIII